MGKSRNSEHYDNRKSKQRAHSKFDKLEIQHGLSEDEVMDLLVDKVNESRNDHEYEKQKA